MARFLLGRLAASALIVVAIHAGTYQVTSWLARRDHPTVYRIGELPPPPSYAAYAAGAAHGDLGRLLTGSRETITSYVARGLAYSSVLLGSAVLVALLAGVLLGYASVDFPRRRVRGLALALNLGGYAMPAFYLGILAVWASWWLATDVGVEALSLPVYGYGIDRHLVLPVVALAVRPATEIARLTAELLVGELHGLYVRTAVAKGARRRAVVMHHAFRNILAGLFAALGATANYMVGSLVVVEVVFGWPGVGRMLAHALAPRTDGRPVASVLFEPQLVSALLSALAILFLALSVGGAVAGRAVDPRLARKA